MAELRVPAAGARPAAIRVRRDRRRRAWSRVLTQHWREGAVLLGGALLVAAVLRMLLPTDRVGLLAIRSRPIDVLCYVGVRRGDGGARADHHPRRRSTCRSDRRPAEQYPA